MKNTIWKFKLPMEDFFNIKMPLGASIISLKVQNNQPYIWAMVDASENNPNLDRSFIMVGTGHPLPKELEERMNYVFIDTFQIKINANVMQVYHVFEYTPFSSFDNVKT